MFFFLEINFYDCSNMRDGEEVKEKIIVITTQEKNLKNNAISQLGITQPSSVF